MADGNLDPELIERINRELALYGKLLPTTAQDLTDAQTGIKNFSKKLNSATGVVGALSDAFVTYNKEVYKGSTANQAAAASIDKMADAAKYAGAFLALLVPGGPVVKALLASLGLVTAKALELGKEIALQTEEIHKAFKDLAQIGATGAGGLQDVFDGLQRVGLGVEKFGAYTKLVADSAKDLALFGGTVRSGRREFEKTMASLTQGQRVELEMMGLNNEAQAQETMRYIRQQRLLTLGTKAQMEISTAAVMRYVKETDELTRITGANREEQQKLLDKYMGEEVFAAFVDELQSQGEAGRRLAEYHVQNIQMLETLMGPEFARGVRDSLTNFVGVSEASKKAFMASNSAVLDYTHAMRDTTISQNQARENVRNLIGAVADVYQTQQRGLAQMGVSETTFGRVSENRRAVALRDLNVAELSQRAEQERLRQLQDPTLRNMAEAEQAARRTALELQRITNIEMETHIKALRAANEENEKIVKSGGKLADEALPAMSKAVGELLEALKPLAKQLTDMVTENIIPRLTSAIRTLTTYIDAWNQGRGSSVVGNVARQELFGSDLPPELRPPPGQLGGGIRAVPGTSPDKPYGLAPDVSPGELLKFWYRRWFGSQDTLGGTGPTDLGARAAGGPVSANRPYLVGEQGPELFVPNSAGIIVPRNQLQRTIKEIAENSISLNKITKGDLKIAKDYSEFYKKYIETKTKFEKDQLELIGDLEINTANRPRTSGTGLQMPVSRGLTTMGGAQGLQVSQQDDLRKMGLVIKQGDVQAEGAGISPQLIALAKQIQSEVPGFAYFSAFNDRFHQERAPSSQHTKGLALDFAMASPPSIEEGRAITDWLLSRGASLAIDEYNNPSRQSTGGHIHAQIPAFEDGGMLGAGKIGIAGEGGKPELITGPATITPMNDLMRSFSNMTALLEISVNKLDAIARATAGTQDASSKMLSYAQN